MEKNNISMLKDSRVWIAGVSVGLIVLLTLVANWDSLHIVVN